MPQALCMYLESVSSSAVGGGAVDLTPLFVPLTLWKSYKTPKTSGTSEKWRLERLGKTPVIVTRLLTEEKEKRRERCARRDLP